MPAPTVLAPAGTHSAPFDIPIAADQVLAVKTAFAHWDGTGASGSFLAALSFYAANGTLLSRVFPLTAVAAGGEADVSYAPFPGGMTTQTGGGGTGQTTLDLVTKSTDVGYTNAITTVITGGAVTYDGATRVKIEFRSAAWDLVGHANDSGGILYLYEDGVQLGFLDYMDITIGLSNVAYQAKGAYGAAIRTPAAGSHTYDVRAQAQHAADTGTVYGAAPEMPMWIAVSTI